MSWWKEKVESMILYCTVLYCTVLYCTVLQVERECGPVPMMLAMNKIDLEAAALVSRSVEGAAKFRNMENSHAQSKCPNF